MEIEIPNVDTSTPEGAKKALGDIFTVAKALGKRNGELEAKSAKLEADLKIVQQSLAEQTRIANATTNTIGPDAELRQFVREDNRVRWVGEATPNDGWEPGLLDAGPSHGASNEEIKGLVEERNLVRAILGRKDPSQIRTCSPKTDKRIRRLVDRCPDAAIKRAFGDISTAGAEGFPDVMLPIVERDYVQERRLAAAFMTMPMSAKNMLLPFLTTGLRPYLKGAVAGDDPAQYTSSSVATAQRALNAIGFAARTQLDEEASEDTIVDSVGLLREELVQALVDGEEDAIINGDSTATHFHTGLSGWDIGNRWGTSARAGASDHRRAWIGLGPRADDVSCTTDNGSAQTFAGMMTGRGAMDAPHGLARDILVITSLTYMIKKISQFAEVVTLEKYGPGASILAGEVAQIGGSPIILSDFVDIKYNASGVYDNST